MKRAKIVLAGLFAVLMTDCPLRRSDCYGCQYATPLDLTHELYVVRCQELRDYVERPRYGETVPETSNMVTAETHR